MANIKKTASKKTTAKKAPGRPAKAAATRTTKTAAKKTAPKKAAAKAPAKKAAPKAAAPKRALGRGLDAMLSSDGIPASKGDSVVELKINDISPNEGQPRKSFDDERLQELAASISESGVIQPIIVQKKKKE